MWSLCLLLGCNLSYIVDLFAALHELASSSARTLLKLASSVRALLKPYGDTLTCFATNNILLMRNGNHALGLNITNGRWLPELSESDAKKYENKI